MEFTVHLRHLHQSPYKVRLIASHIRGMKAVEAEQRLPFIRKHSVAPILKLLQSGMAAAENNYKLNKQDLVISKIMVNEGVTMKRWQPKAFGRAGRIRKRSAHVALTLSDGKPEVATKVEKKEEQTKQSTTNT